jgi:tRNA G46 methylase TrmB
MVVRKLKKGISVCDVGCGEGVALMVMAEAFPRSRFIGIDISQGVVEIAASAAKENGFKTSPFKNRMLPALDKEAEIARIL